MTEHDTALAFDRALNGERGISLNGAESLVLTAHAIQTLFDRQQEIPSEEFVMHLEHTLFGPSTLPVIPSAVEGPPAAAVSRPQPTPRPASIQPNRSRIFPRWAAIAAALILVLGGVGALVLDPLDWRSTPEPSAIPAAMLGTVEASPEPVGKQWSIAPMPGTSGSDRPPLISDGMAFRTFYGSSSSPVQAIDLQSGTVIWEELPGVTTEVLVTTGDDLLVAGSDGINWQLVALDGRSGSQHWDIELPQRPVGLSVADGQIVVLGNKNLLESYDLESQQLLWSADLAQYDDAAAAYGGANQFGDLTGDRLAMLDGTIGVIVSNGRLVAIDAGDGSVKWADERTTDGWTRVTVVDGKFVVTAFSGEPLMYDPEATPLPLTPSDPAADPCTLTIESRIGSAPKSAPDHGETVDSFDPQTGASPWGLALPEQYFVWPVDGLRLIAQVEHVQSAGIADSGDLIRCLIDGSTGTVSETTGLEFADFVVTNPDTGGLAAFGALPSGVLLGLAVGPNEAAPLPHLEVDPTQYGWFRWVQTTDDLILITGQDGTLIGLPASSPSKTFTEATPAGATPVLDSSWIAYSPDAIVKPDDIGYTYQEEVAETGNAHLTDDGRVFRAFSLQAGGNVVQAIDARTGDALWETEIDSSGAFMMTSGDVLLVAGKDDKGGGHLVALSMTTGQQVWTTGLSDEPVGMMVAGARALVLGDNDTLDAIDIETGQVEYAVDIHGDAQHVAPTVSRDRYIDEHRMAIDGGTLYATLADGGVVAVDWETGTAKWWSLRPSPGQVQVYVVDGVVVTVDQGDLRKVQTGFITVLPGTPVVPITPVPATFSCTAPDVEADPVATPFSAGFGATVNATYRGLDPASGGVLWTNSIPGESSWQFQIDDGLLVIISSREAGTSGSSELEYCFVDTDAGQISNVNPLDISASPILQFDDPRSSAAGRTLAILIGRDVLPISPESASGVTRTVVVFDSRVEEKIKDGWTWRAVYQNRIYYSLLDGDLVSIPIPDE